MNTHFLHANSVNRKGTKFGRKHLTLDTLQPGPQNGCRHTTCSNVLPFMRHTSTVDYLCCQLIGHPPGILGKQWGTPPVRTHICPIYFPLRDC